MATSTLTSSAPQQAPPLTCGIIMPISPIDGCSAEHWSDVKTIIHEALDSMASPKFSVSLVSDADDIGVIQKRIVQGIYNSDVVICDVSAKNSNVMFELGMRLAFDKPTVLIKDDKTDYSFDTSIIEHLPYPRDLRFSKIVAFKRQLAEKVLATYEASQRDPTHSTFLKNFGTFKVAHLDQKEAPSEQVMLELLGEVQREVSQLRRQLSGRNRQPPLLREGVPGMVAALIELRKAEPNMPLEANDDMVNRLVGYSGLEVTSRYPTKESFQEAADLACEIVRNLR